MQNLIPVNYPAYLSPTYLPVPYVDAETIRRFQEENDRLKSRLEQKTIKEYALRQAYRLQGEAYWTTLRSGNLVQFSDFVFERVQCLYFDPCTGQCPMVEIKISHNPCVYFTVDELLDDRRFLKLLQIRTNGKIISFGSASQMATLLRSLACEKMESVIVPFFSGWHVEDNQWVFSVFSDFQTCARTALPVRSCEAPPEVLPYAAKIAADHFQRDYALIQNPFLRTTLLLWQHIAFLYTPLSSFGCHVKFALHINVSGVVIRNYLERLLCFGKDQSILLDADPAEFKRELSLTKDRPLLISEGHAFNGTATQNAGSLREAIRSGKITLLTKSHESVSVPLRTLPVILGGENSILAWQPEVIPIRIEKTDIDWNICEEIAHNLSFNMEYWTAFATYTEENISDIYQLLKTDLHIARTLADEHELYPELADVLGIMLAVRHFLEKFTTYLGCPSFDNGEDWQNSFLQVLEENCLQAETLDGLAEIFIETGRQMLRDGRLAKCQYGLCEVNADPRGTVYYNHEIFALDRDAFSHICQEAKCNPSAVKRDLRDKGYFQGKTVNECSYMSRISCCNAYGQTHNIRVYKFTRDTFEKLGEPLLL